MGFAPGWGVNQRSIRFYLLPLTLPLSQSNSNDKTYPILIKPNFSGSPYVPFPTDNSSIVRRLFQANWGWREPVVSLSVPFLVYAFSPKASKDIVAKGILKGKYHCIIDLLFDWFGLVCFAKKKIVRGHTANSKLVKQEVSGTVILPHLVFPE